MIGIICAMELEIEKIREGMTDVTEEKHAGVVYTLGKKKGADVVMAVSGAGKVFAAICTQAMIDNFHPEVILNVGVAGSLSTDLSIGDIVMAEQLVQHDMDVTALGLKKGQLYGSDYRFFPANSKVIDLIKECLELVNLEREKEGKKALHAIKGTVASGDVFVADSGLKKSIVDEFQAVACEMEGAAIAQVCCVNEIRFGVIRAISDSANEDSTMDYGEFSRMLHTGIQIGRIFPSCYCNTQKHTDITDMSAKRIRIGFICFHLRSIPDFSSDRFDLIEPCIAVVCFIIGFQECITCCDDVILRERLFG